VIGAFEINLHSVRLGVWFLGLVLAELLLISGVEFDAHPTQHY
jgi:hypothetical protein